MNQLCKSCVSTCVDGGCKLMDAFQQGYDKGRKDAILKALDKITDELKSEFSDAWWDEIRRLNNARTDDAQQ